MGNEYCDTFFHFVGAEAEAEQRGDAIKDTIKVAQELRKIGDGINMQYKLGYFLSEVLERLDIREVISILTGIQCAALVNKLFF